MTIYLSTAARHKPHVASPQRASDETRARILGAAERLFAEQGFSLVSMPAIAKASGITAGAIYRHFAGKDDLFFEVVARTVTGTRFPADANPSGSLPRMIALYTTAPLKLLRQLAVELHYSSGRNPKLRRLLKRSIEGNIAQLVTALEDYRKAGRLDPALDIELLASTIMVFVMGLMHMETLVPTRIGDKQWHDFVEDRVAALISLRSPLPREGERGKG
jgi:AcrR family transcriptional regulator